MALGVVDDRDAHYPPISAMRAIEPEYIRAEDRWAVAQPRFSFSCKVGVDPRLRGTPVPSAPELWRVGLVQNVVFEWIRFEYDNRGTFEETWSTSVVDYADTEALPFVTGQRETRVRVVGEYGLSEEMTFKRTGVRHLWYSRGGLQELSFRKPPPNPYAASFAGSGRTYELEYEDMPFTGFKARFGRDDVLLSFHHVLALQFWVVALSPQNDTHVLAHSPPFTLMNEMLMHRPPPGLAAGMPRMLSWHAHSINGIHRRYRPSGGYSGGTIAPRRGSGGREPVLRGISANERFARWLREQGLSR